MIQTSICQDIVWLKNCLELDVHHMTSQTLSILNDFIQDRPFYASFIQQYFKSLDLNNSRSKNDIKKTVNDNFLDFWRLSDKTIKIFMSSAF